MALKTKTFRTSDNVIEALVSKAEILDVSESEIINKALKCFLGVVEDMDCATYSRYDELFQELQSLRQELTSKGVL